MTSYYGMTSLIFLLVVPIALSSLVRWNQHLKTAQFFTQTALKPVTTFPEISIIIPVRGLDQGAESNYLSYIQQDYPASFEVIFALEEECDPAVSLVRKLIAAYPHRTIRLILSHGAPGIGKIKNQIAATRACQHDLWVLIDSDVSLSPDFLRSQIAWLATAPDVGLVYAPPIGFGARDWVAALHNMGVSASVLNSCSAAIDGSLTAAVGSCIATRRDVIHAIGGLDTIAHQVVGLDISLGQAVVRSNYKIELLPQPARIYHERDTFKRYWWQVHRWLTTINYYFPQFWIVAVVLGIPVFWAFTFTAIAFSIGQYETLGLVLIIYTMTFEIASAGMVNAKISKDKKLWKYIWLAPVNQLIMLPLLLLSRISTSVKWRGQWLSIQSDKIAKEENNFVKHI